MNLTELSAIGPIDGRYRRVTKGLSSYFSEASLIQYRIKVEIEYFIALAQIPLPQLKSYKQSTNNSLRSIYINFNENDALRITDLHQGIVWGTQTTETELDERLVNRFDYDGDYGTVLNRFLMQAAINFPLTVHGTGGQTRAFIHIKDTIKCIEIALINPPIKGEKVKIFNQICV